MTLYDALPSPGPAPGARHLHDTLRALVGLVVLTALAARADAWELPAPLRFPEGGGQHSLWVLGWSPDGKLAYLYDRPAAVTCEAEPLLGLVDLASNTRLLEQPICITGRDSLSALWAGTRGDRAVLARFKAFRERCRKEGIEPTAVTTLQHWPHAYGGDSLSVAVLEARSGAVSTTRVMLQSARAGPRALAVFKDAALSPGPAGKVSGFLKSPTGRYLAVLQSFTDATTGPQLHVLGIDLESTLDGGHPGLTGDQRPPTTPR